MTDAQTGLAVVTPMIVGTAYLFYRMGVLQKGGVIIVALASCFIAAVLFLSQ